MGDPAIDIGKLSQEERLELIEELWGSLSEDQRNSLPLTEAQRDELDRRIDLLDREGPVGVSPEELYERIKSLSRKLLVNLSERLAIGRAFRKN